MGLNYLFDKEKKLLYNVQNHIDDLKCGVPVNRELFELLAKEYGIILKQMQKLVGISDKTSEILINEKKSKQERIIDLENQLLQKHISVLLSQIQPHFLYNSLVVIRELCRSDPKMAEETVIEFSNYLRNNLESLALCELIPFKKELKHVQTYLAIEKKRFADRLNIVYNITTYDFLLPALTLQPIVENAVRHGITKKTYGGEVAIITEKSENRTVISVIDDGVGFDPKTLQNSPNHIGIENVRSRLEAMCEGLLEIQSKPGSGTTAIITIPDTN